MAVAEDFLDIRITHWTYYAGRHQRLRAGWKLVFVQVAGIDGYRHSFDFWRQLLVVVCSVGAVSWNL